MTEVVLRMLLWATVGLALVLLLRSPARRVFGAGPAFTLWLLPVVLALAPLLPDDLAPAAAWSLPALVVTPHAGVGADVVVSIDWAYWLIGAWLAVVAAGLVRLSIHYLRLRRGMRSAPAAWALWLAQAAPGLDPRRVRMHPAGPAVLWALPRALILLPADFAQRFDNTATRELVLRHELTHARRGDAWWTLAMEIISALLWFHPLMWLARSRFRLDQELACDATSLRAQPDRTTRYARALLDSVAVQPVPALIPWLAEPQLKERIAMITRIPPGALRRRAGFLAIAALLGGGLLLAGGQTPLQAATETPSTIRVDHLKVVGAGATPPTVDITYRANNPPHYPGDALQAGHQGTVMLDVTVDASGTVTSIAVDPHGTNAAPDLQVAALQAASNWKFNPGHENGKPAGGTLKVPVNFALQGYKPPKVSCQLGETYVSQTKQCVKLQSLPPSS